MRVVDGAAELAESDALMSTSLMVLAACATAAVLLENQPHGIVVQTVNNEVKRITGFAPDQLLRRTVDCVVPAKADGDPLCANARLAQFLHDPDVQDGAAERFVVQAVTETGGYAVMMCNALRLPRGGALLLLLRDITEDSRRRQHAAALRARSVRILEDIIPAAVRQRPPQRADVATVVFVEIMGITECIHTVSQRELLAMLNSVYERIEGAVAQCPDMLPVKSLEQLFVGAVGLRGGISSGAQVSQALEFAFGLLGQVDEILDQEEPVNIRLKTVVNTGGPITFGPLAGNLPTFEVCRDVVTDTIAMLVDAETGMVLDRGHLAFTSR
jgi:hypothetical protein